MTEIDVTQKDIDEGEQADCIDCPIARAAQRAFGDMRRKITVDDWTLYVGPISYALPDEARWFMQLFDSGQPVKPFSFTVGEPWER